MSPQECEPTFFIVGAPKCGTTSLHFYLDAHPEISMARVKEPNVLSDARWLPSLESYEGLFDCSAACRGESSTSYSRYPAEGDAAARIHERLPDAKLLYLARDPIERIVSDYTQAVAVGVERRSIDEALSDFHDPENWYVCASRYKLQIDRYLEFFDASSLLVIDQGELRDRREKTLEQVFRFLEVDEEFWSEQFRPELWARDDNVRYQGLEWRLRTSLLGRAFRKLPLRFRLPVSRALRRRARPVPRPVLDPALHRELVEFFEPDVELVEAMTGKPLQRQSEGDTADPSSR